MSTVQTNTRREPLLYSVPAARAVLPAYNAANTFIFPITVPEKKVLSELYIDAKLTTVGAGMTTSKVSQIFDKIWVKNEAMQTLDIDKYTLDMAAVILASMRNNNEYPENIAVNTNVVRDPPNVATGATLYGSWRLWTPLSGKLMNVILSTYDLTTVFGATMTGGTLSLQVVPFFADADEDSVNKKQYTVYARQQANQTKLSLKAIEMLALVANAELSSIASGIDYDGSSTSEQILRREVVANELMRGYAADGSSTATDTLPVKDPLPATDMFVYMKHSDNPSDAKITLSTAHTINTITLQAGDTNDVLALG